MVMAVAQVDAVTWVPSLARGTSACPGHGPPTPAKKKKKIWIGTGGNPIFIPLIFSVQEENAFFSKNSHCGITIFLCSCWCKSDSVRSCISCLLLFTTWHFRWYPWRIIVSAIIYALYIVHAIGSYAHACT